MTNSGSVLSKIDRATTQRKVEGVLESVRIYKQFGTLRKEMRITSSYERREHGSTHIVGKPVEDVAMANIQQSEREEWLEDMSCRVEEALSRFGNGEAGNLQRDIIVKRYLEDEDVCDYMIYNEMGMSERTYRRVKARALYKLAFALRLEVYQTEEIEMNEQRCSAKM
ncbi:ArpU family phage packaging/lysis transcriptional regulator [Bacillus thuringiensis]|nr:ArpU family phage packaging/lysis transcriptional regulator [Bacillus thuringiensis]